VEEEWDLNSKHRVEMELSLEEVADIAKNPQAESAPNQSTPPAMPAYSKDYPDGALPYA